MVIVKEYSSEPLTELPEAGRSKVAEIEKDKDARAALITLIEGLIKEEASTADVFGTWDALVEGAQRLLPITVLRPVLAAEKRIMAAWRDSALTGSGFGDVRRNMSVVWGNCGMTTLNVMARLRNNYGATISLTDRVTFTKDTSDGLKAAMTRKPTESGEIFLLDCDLQGIHNFLVEVHSDGKCYLIQGYQGAYTAVWWVSAGLADPAIDKPVPSALVGIRSGSGGGQNISGSYEKLTALLLSIVNDGFNVLVDGSKAWRQLPFYPDDPAPAKISDLPYLKIDLYRIRNPQAVLGSTGALSGALSVQAVLSLPIEAPAVNVDEVTAALAKLGLTVTYKLDTGNYHKFTVTDDKQGTPLPSLKGKLVIRVGGKEVTRLSRTDLPETGQQVEVGYLQAGVEKTVTRTVA
jgi:hypothetical protein